MYVRLFIFFIVFINIVLMLHVIVFVLLEKCRKMRKEYSDLFSSSSFCSARTPPFDKSPLRLLIDFSPIIDLERAEYQV